MNLGFFSNGLLNCFNASNNQLDEVHVGSGRTAVFFDRDGVINKDDGYVSKFDRSLIYDEFTKCLQLLVRNKIQTGIATNQSGISRRKYSWSDFETFHQELNNYFSHLSLPELDAIACSWHPMYGNGSELNNWRKPGPNMLLFLCCVNGVSPRDSIFIGDRVSDVEAAISAKFRYVIRVQDNVSESSHTVKSTTIVTILRNKLSSVIEKMTTEGIK